MDGWNALAQSKAKTAYILLGDGDAHRESASALAERAELEFRRLRIGRLQQRKARRGPQRAPRIDRALVATVSALLTLGGSLSGPPLDSRSGPRA